MSAADGSARPMSRRLASQPNPRIPPNGLPAQQRLSSVLFIGQQAMADAQQARHRTLHQRVDGHGCRVGNMAEAT